MNCEKRFEVRQDTTPGRQRVPLIWADCAWTSEIFEIRRNSQTAAALRASTQRSLYISGRARAHNDLRNVRVLIG
jgi:hypothetical protein